MSTGFECEIRELRPGAWYYILQDWDCPVGAWDWREYASVVGPYASAELAIKGLHDNEANPGGYFEVLYDERSKARNDALLGRARRPDRW